MAHVLADLLEANPSIAGVKDENGLRMALRSDCRIIFVLFGDVLNIGNIVRKVKEYGKLCCINVDLIEGFSSKDVVIQFLKQHTQADGILSSKAAMIKAAKAAGFITIHRFFIIDSFSYHNLGKQIEISRPDYVEIMPGWPKVISWVVNSIHTPVIAGGLVCEKGDALEALRAGAKAISSTNPIVWSLN